MEREQEISVEVAKGKCKVCGGRRDNYYLSGFLYGVRLLTTEDGRYYAYLNCFDDTTFEEVKLLMRNIFGNKKISQQQETDCFNKIFGVSCDYVKGLRIDASRIKAACLVCGSEELDIKEEYPPLLKKVKLPIISHDAWDKLDLETKKNIILNEFNQKCSI